MFFYLFLVYYFIITIELGISLDIILVEVFKNNFVFDFCKVSVINSRKVLGLEKRGFFLVCLECL